MIPSRSLHRQHLAARVLVLGFTVVLASGCSTIAYYRQAIGGHLDIMCRRVDVEKVVHDPGTDPELRRQLELVARARGFASETLLLPDNDSYRSYVDIGRPFVVWNVFAAPELSLDPIRSCFLFVGCLSYRGYFDEKAAENAARVLRAEGNDVFVGGVAAYSTLGWFDDPVLNTMLTWGDVRLVEVIFHELAHQLIYVDDDSVFNESFATAVAEFGIQMWLAKEPAALAIYAENELRENAFYALLLDFQERLEALYRSDVGDAEKRERKSALYASLVADYEALKLTWAGYTGFDEWMYTDLNNAKIASVATYRNYVPAFRTILKEADHDLERFYAAVRALASESPERRQQCLGDQAEGALCIHELTTKP